MSRLRSTAVLVSVFAMLSSAAARLSGQSVRPIISEYSGRADGYLEVVNDAAVPQIVLLEPKSFSVDQAGVGTFRPLDPNIHLDLSATSIRLQPLQTARIFYKVNADALPAWLCIYAVFTPAKKTEGINVRVMLPHTVYVYQKENLAKAALLLHAARFDRMTQTVTCELENTGASAGRAESVEVTGPHHTETQGGFPMLPQLHRKLTIAWQSNEAPKAIAIQFPTFTLKAPVESDPQ